jgi:hypothetical protein
MSDHAMNEDQVEAMAWELETKMMEIRKDPRAALTAGLARIRSIMLAEYKADWEKWQGDFPRGNVPTVKGALRSIHRNLDDRPISMKL